MAESKAYKVVLGETIIGKSVCQWGRRTYIMGIINLSPDSFSGDGFRDTDDAILKAQQMVIDGADIIDVGGEWTAAGRRSGYS